MARREKRRCDVCGRTQNDVDGIFMWLEEFGFIDGETCGRAFCVRAWGKLMRAEEESKHDER